LSSASADFLLETADWNLSAKRNLFSPSKQTEILGSDVEVAESNHMPVNEQEPSSYPVIKTRRQVPIIEVYKFGLPVVSVFRLRVGLG